MVNVGFFSDERCYTHSFKLYSDKMRGTPRDVQSPPLTELKGAVAAIKKAFSDPRINDVHRDILALI